nr:MAG TPA: hypothetical protein [Caudoviricetes sp.]
MLFTEYPHNFNFLFVISAKIRHCAKKLKQERRFCFTLFYM